MNTGRRQIYERITKPCDTCGKPVTRPVNQFFGHTFCSRACMKGFSTEHLRALNRKLNPTRMTPETRAKLREARLNTGEGKTYSKTYGRHTHRIVAEQMLGRPLRKGEVVHHIDGNKRNNDPSNLIVFASQAEHARHHMELRKGGDAR